MHNILEYMNILTTILHILNIEAAFSRQILFNDLFVPLAILIDISMLIEKAFLVLLL